MKSVYNFVVTPIGERYNNTKKVEGGNLILNTEIFNHQYVNREATVISTPIAGYTDIQVGDTATINRMRKDREAMKKGGGGKSRMRDVFKSEFPK